MTGDWGGLRSQMANNGVQLDMDIVHMFQNVTSGGIDTTGRYWSMSKESRCFITSP